MHLTATERQEFAPTLSTVPKGQVTKHFFSDWKVILNWNICGRTNQSKYSTTCWIILVIIEGRTSKRAEEESSKGFLIWIFTLSWCYNNHFQSTGGPLHKKVWGASSFLPRLHASDSFSHNNLNYSVIFHSTYYSSSQIQL